MRCTDQQRPINTKPNRQKLPMMQSRQGTTNSQITSETPYGTVPTTTVYLALPFFLTEQFILPVLYGKGNKFGQRSSLACSAQGRLAQRSHRRERAILASYT
jgi:hypothetical protein